ncbi:hypothetical protein M5K25_020085 [Dendrobium thyrsiflorum]|uniref:Uncharacterized protein n=1 Tax=Dendrobium thyrsiflorum TaxID=117978 RepID=A0ABD0UG14_DENTH
MKSRAIVFSRAHKSFQVDVAAPEDDLEMTLLSELKEAQVKLRNEKVLPPHAFSRDKGKQVIEESESSIPPQRVPLQGLVKGGMSEVYYNVLAHLRILHAKLSIYDAQIFFKEMREALIKALQDPDICMVQLAAA